MRNTMTGLRVRQLLEPSRSQLGLILLSLACAFGTVSPITAQEPAGASDMLVPVLDAIRDSLPPGRAVLDTRILCTDTSTCDRWNGERPLTMAGRLATRIRGVTGSLDQIRRCLPNEPTSCRLTGAGVVVAVSEPTVSNDVATVYVNLWFNTGQARAPVAERSYVVTLRRPDGVWMVEQIVVDRRT